MNVLLWFTGDLRARSNPALLQAARLGPVLPLYVFDPSDWQGGSRSSRQCDFVAESLRDLRADMAALGAPLVVRVGDTLSVLERLARRHGCTVIVCRDHPRPVPALDTARLRGWAEATGLTLVQAKDVVESGADVEPLLVPVAGVEPGRIPTARGLGLMADPCPHRQPGGRTAAEAALVTHLARRPMAPSPLFAAAERAASRLSPFLAHGVLSPLAVQLAVQAARKESPVRPHRTGAALLRGLDRRQALVPEERRVDHVDDLRGIEHDQTRTEAWCAGQTGLPFTDACLRYLAATGWLPDRARALVLSVACHHLGLDWREASRHLAAMSTDHDPDLAWPLSHDVAIGAGPAGPRVADPITTGLAMDPVGALIRAWVPELKAVPDDALHRPWRWDRARGFLGTRYPEPVVDPAAATRAARAGAGSGRQLDFGFACRR